MRRTYAVGIPDVGVGVASESRKLRGHRGHIPLPVFTEMFAIK